MGWPYQQKPPLGWPLDYDSGLVPEAGLWLMSEDGGGIIQDLSGNGNTGTFDATNPPVWIAGQYGSSLDIDTTPIQPIVLTSAITLTEGTIVAFVKYSGGTNKMLTGDNTTSNYFLKEVGNWNVKGGGTSRDFSDNMSAGWHLVVLIIKAAGCWLYIDGIPDSGNPVGATGTFTINTIGNGYNSNAYVWDGDISHISIFNRILSNAEIAQLCQFPFWMFKDPAEVVILGGQAAGGNLAVNVSDSVVIAESVSTLLPLLEATLSDAVVVSESVTALLPLLEVSASETVVVAESKSAAVESGERTVSVSDSAVVAESVTAQLPLLEVSESDSVVVAESVTGQLPLYEVDLSTDIKSELAKNSSFGDWTSDNPDDWTVTGESGSDPEASEVGSNEGHGGSGKGLCNLYTTNNTVTVSQLIATTVGKKYRASIFVDKVTSGAIRFGDATNSQFLSAEISTTGLKTVTFTGSDTLCQLAVWTKSSQANDVTVDDFSLGEAKVDYAIVTESVTAQLPLYEVSVSDSVVTAESVTAQLPLYEVSVSDSIVVSESVTALLPLYEVSEYESVVVSESSTAYIYTPLLYVSESESVVVAEAVLAELMTAVVAMPIISSQGVIHNAIFSSVIVRGHNK